MNRAKVERADRPAMHSGPTSLILAAIAAYLGLAASHLASLVFLSFLYRRQAHAEPARPSSFAVIVPARNEEELIGRLLESIEAAEYPASCIEVHVIADNCTDSTAAVAARPGVVVHERYANPGKAAAIGWLVRRLDLSRFDGVAVIDADAVAAPDFLKAASGCLSAGHEAVQAWNEILNESASPTNELTAWAFRLQNRHLPMGREVMGVSAGLSGNGMVFARRVFEAIDWANLGPAEDREMHAALVLRGYRVHFEPAARVMSDLPVSPEGVRQQHRRWDRGAVQAARLYAHPLLASGLARRDWNLLSSGIALASPTVSVQVALGIACTVLGQSSGRTLSRNLSLAGLALTSAAAAASYSRGSRRPALAMLANVPPYLALKLKVYFFS